MCVCVVISLWLEDIFQLFPHSSSENKKLHSPTNTHNHFPTFLSQRVWMYCIHVYMRRFRLFDLCYFSFCASQKVQMWARGENNNWGSSQKCHQRVKSSMAKWRLLLTVWAWNHLWALKAKISIRTCVRKHFGAKITHSCVKIDICPYFKKWVFSKMGWKFLND